MLVVGQDVDFGKYGVARVTVIDPNVTEEAQKRREEALLKVGYEAVDRMRTMRGRG